MFVGTSRRPIDIEHGDSYMSHGTHFQEVGLLEEVLHARFSPGALIHEAEDSMERTILVNQHNLPAEERVYVLYVYLDVSIVNLVPICY